MIGLVAALLLSLLNPAARSAIAQTNDSSEAVAGSYTSNLKLVHIDIFNALKDGTPLSEPSVFFGVASVRFVGWRAEFRCANGDSCPGHHEVVAEYFAPDGHLLGRVNDFETRTGDRISCDGRVGNHAGGAFLRGRYTIKFYLDHNYLDQRYFDIVPLPADAAQAEWYLMTPPPSQPNPNQPDLFAPMTEWTVDETFASQGECQKFYWGFEWLARFPEFNSALARAGENGLKYSADRARKFCDAAECIAADDPSLKPN